MDTEKRPCFDWCHSLSNLPAVHQQIIIGWLQQVPRCVQLDETANTFHISQSAVNSAHQQFLKDYMQHTVHPCGWSGCDRQIPLLEWRAHMETCGKRTAPCPWAGCEERPQHDQLEAHARACEHREVECKWCKRKGCFSLVRMHEAQCFKKPSKCEHAGCTVHLEKFALKQHMQKCPFRPMQCKWCQQNFPAHALQQHVEDCAKHLLVCPECPQNIRLQAARGVHTFRYAKRERALHLSCCVKHAQKCPDCHEEIPTRLLAELVRPTMRLVEKLQLQNQRWFPEQGTLFTSSMIGDSHDGVREWRYVWLHHSLSLWRVEDTLAEDSLDYTQILASMGPDSRTSSLFHETPTMRPYFWDQPLQKLYALSKVEQLLSSARSELVTHKIRCHLTPDLLAFDRDHIQQCAGCDKVVRNVRCDQFKAMVEHVRDRKCHHSPQCVDCRKVRLLLLHHPLASCGCRLCQRVPCFWAPYGCTECPMLRERDAHESACKFGRKGACPHCHASMPSSDPSDLRAHMLQCAVALAERARKGAAAAASSS